MNLKPLKNAIDSFPDFPIKDIIFKDLNPIYKDPRLFSLLIDYMKQEADKIGSFDYIVGIEARGFILGAVLAQKLGIGFIPIRKKGKLPGQVDKIEYALEYGTDTLEIQHDEKLKNAKVLIIDDVFATGGTLKAVIKLIEKFTSEIAYGIVLDIGIADISSLGKDYFLILDNA
ncbi:adenine phosphoribosyltransferase [Candidatus Margulisiibacteriota bacterium]